MSVGANIDGHTSTDSDPSGCNKADFTHTVTGESGIDNGLSGLLPVIEASLGESVGEALITEINRGGLVLLFGVDADHADDDQATLTLYRGLVPGGGAPEVDGDGIAADQVFDIDESTLAPLVVPATLTDGVVVAQLPELTMPVGTRGGVLDLVIQAPLIRATVEEGTLTGGEIAGALAVDQLVDGLAPFVAETIDESDLRTLLSGAADLVGSGGDCDGLSIAFTFDAVSAIGGEVL